MNRGGNLAQTLWRGGLLLALGTVVSGCEGVRTYHGPESVIAVPTDGGVDPGGLVNGEAAIAYDPDGCQVWIIDDGLEGYSSPRYNPKTGLPICDNKYPPGTIIGVYQTESAPINDWVRK